MPEPLKLSKNVERLYASAIELIPRGKKYSMAVIEAMLRNRIGISDDDAMVLVLAMAVRGAIIPAGNRRVIRI